MKTRATAGVSRRWRTAALLAIGIAIGTTMTATPVYSHVGGTVAHLWTKHIRPKTDARYYTKAQSEGRYVNVGEKATSAAQADAAASANTAANAANADKVDNLDSTAFLGASAKAADADKLDGVDSTGFLQAGAVDAFHGAPAFLPAAPTGSGFALTTLNVTLARPARLFVMGSLITSVSCSGAGACTGVFGLSVDGVHVANSQRGVGAAASSSSGNQRLELRGLSAELPAGAHAITLRAHGGTNVSGQFWDERTLSAIALP
jgi:hypothetical protein